MSPMAINASAIIFTTSEELLIVRDRRSARWILPGGRVEPHETPSAACEREVWEELGLQIDPGPPALIDFWLHRDATSSLYVVFRPSPPRSSTDTAIRLQSEELSEWRYVPPSDAFSLLFDPIAARLESLISCGNAFLYLENGSRIV